MTTHPVDELLELSAPMLDELVLVSAGDLLVGQRRDGDEAELLHEPLVQPVEVLVSPGDRVGAEAGQQLVRDELLDALELRLHLWRGHRHRVLVVERLPEVNSLLVQVDVDLVALADVGRRGAHDVGVRRLREHLRGLARHRHAGRGHRVSVVAGSRRQARSVTGLRSARRSIPTGVLLVIEVAVEVVVVVIRVVVAMLLRLLLLLSVVVRRRNDWIGLRPRIVGSRYEVVAVVRGRRLCG